MKTKKIMMLLMAVVLFGLNSCKKETVDVTDLLRSIPSSSSGVMVFNLEGLLEDAGCKIKGHEISPSKEVMELIQRTSNAGTQDIMMLFDGSTGIEPKGAVVFYDSNRIFLTFALYDVNKFTEFVEKREGGKFINEGDGVNLLGKIAIKGSQAWICLSQGKRIDPEAIKGYSALGASQSFLVTPMGENLLVEEDDIRGWALINTFINEMLGRSERSMATLGVNFLFEDAESVKFKIDFKKGEIEADAMVLNSKGKAAKYLLPSEKIDISTLKSLGENCDAMMAFTVTPKLIKKFEQVGSALGGSLFGDLGDTFKNVDGTVGIVSGGEGIAESINGVVTTKGEVSKILRDLISQQMAPVRDDGKYLRFSKGDVKGNLDVKECAEELKGSCMGIIFDATGYNSVGYGDAAPNGLKTLCLKFKPESGGLELELELKTTDEKENSLLTLLRDVK